VPCNPPDHGDTDGVPKPKQSLIHGHIDLVAISTHQTRAFSRSEKANPALSVATTEKNLPSAATPRGPEASGNSIGAQLAHRTPIAHSPKYCAV